MRVIRLRMTQQMLGGSGANEVSGVLSRPYCYRTKIASNKNKWKKRIKRKRMDMFCVHPHKFYGRIG